MLLEITTPDGRVIRQEHESIEDAQDRLQAGYKVTGRVFGAAADHTGGMVGSLDASAPSIIEALLEAYGDELEDWLMERGVICRSPDPQYSRGTHHRRDRR